MLCFIPETLDGSTYSINQLADMANALSAIEGQSKVVWEGDGNKRNAWRLNAGASLLSR